MTQQIYIETSVVSYLTARESNDAVRSACQQITKWWWNNDRLNSVSYISPYVIQEASAGDSQAASARLNALRTIPVLPISGSSGFNMLDKMASCADELIFPDFQRNSSISYKNISYPEEP